MTNFNKNKLINEVLDKYYETFSHTLDTADYVPEKYNDKINRYIFKNMKKAFRKIDKEDRIFQHDLKIKEYLKLYKEGKLSRFKAFIYGFCKKDKQNNTKQLEKESKTAKTE